MRGLGLAFQDLDHIFSWSTPSRLLKTKVLNFKRSRPIFDDHGVTFQDKEDQDLTFHNQGHSFLSQWDFLCSLRQFLIWGILLSSTHFLSRSGNHFHFFLLSSNFFLIEAPYFIFSHPLTFLKFVLPFSEIKPLTLFTFYARYQR